MKRFFLVSYLAIVLILALQASGIMPAIVPALVPTGNKIGNSIYFQLGNSVSPVSGNCANFDASGNITDAGAPCGGAGSTAFSAITSATNTTAAMLVGTGATLGPTASGTLTANALSGNAAILSCEPGLGDGNNAIPAATYLQTTCINKTGGTLTIGSIQCLTDNAGTSTLNATNGAGTGLLTGAVTCNATIPGASGTQSATTTLANDDAIKFTFVADGTSKQTTWTIKLSR